VSEENEDQLDAAQRVALTAPDLAQVCREYREAMFARIARAPQRQADPAIALEAWNQAVRTYSQARGGDPVKKSAASKGKPNKKGGTTKGPMNPQGK
jgi:acyl-CoA reductase-like NAD-dependent aldehyde dehydrogenase